MSVAIRTITRLQDADDVNVTPAVGVDEYALTYDHDTAKFVLRAPAVPFDGTPYALLAGRAGGQTLYGGTAANEDITIHGTSDGTRATSYVLLQPTAGNVGIGTSAPTALLHIYPASGNLLLTMSRPASTVQNLMQFDTADTPSIGDPRYLLGLSQNTKYFSIGRWNGGILSTDFTISTLGLIGIGTVAPTTQLHVTSTNATTSALRNVLTLSANVTGAGVGAAGLGAAVLFTMETTTTADTSAARIAALWYEATDATFKADLVGYASDKAGEREIWRGRANGSAPALGVLGATPIARKAHVADPAGGATVDAEARAAINAILVSLEDFGFHATS